DEQGSGPKSEVPGSKSAGGSSDAAPLNNPKPEGLDARSSASEIAGETTGVIGEATGAFPGAGAVERSERESTAKSAFMVGAGILISRIIGVVRQRVFAHYLGISDAAGAFNAAFRIPNFLQNVFGEGALSASFIPVYARLLAQDDDKEARHVASAVFGLLALVTSLIVLLGVLTTPYFVTIIAGGFQDERRDLTIQLIRLFFPGAVLLV